MTSTTRIATATLILFGMALAPASCGNDSSSSGTGGGAGDASMDTGSARPDADSSRPVDACEAHADRASCCSDPACGWHVGTGQMWYDVAPCVDRLRVCEVNGVTVRDCPDGMICVITGGWQTEDDCAEDPPNNVVNLNGRGICVWPIEDSGSGPPDALPEFPPECPPEGCAFD